MTALDGSAFTLALQHRSALSGALGVLLRFRSTSGFDAHGAFPSGLSVFGPHPLDWAAHSAVVRRLEAGLALAALVPAAAAARSTRAIRRGSGRTDDAAGVKNENELAAEFADTAPQVSSTARLALGRRASFSATSRRDSSEGLERGSTPAPGRRAAVHESPRRVPRLARRASAPEMGALLDMSGRSSEAFRSQGHERNSGMLAAEEDNARARKEKEKDAYSRVEARAEVRVKEKSAQSRIYLEEAQEFSMSKYFAHIKEHEGGGQGSDTASTGASSSTSIPRSASSADDLSRSARKRRPPPARAHSHSNIVVVRRCGDDSNSSLFIVDPSAEAAVKDSDLLSFSRDENELGSESDLVRLSVKATGRVVSSSSLSPGIHTTNRELFFSKKFSNALDPVHTGDIIPNDFSTCGPSANASVASATHKNEMNFESESLDVGKLEDLWKLDCFHGECDNASPESGDCDDAASVDNSVWSAVSSSSVLSSLSSRSPPPAARPRAKRMLPAAAGAYPPSASVAEAKKVHDSALQLHEAPVLRVEGASWSETAGAGKDVPSQTLCMFQTLSEWLSSAKLSKHEEKIRAAG